MTIDFHLTSCLYVGVGKMCSQRQASEDCVYDTANWGREGFVRGLDCGDVDDSGMFSDVRLVLRRFPNVGSSRGGVLMGEYRDIEPR